MQEIWSYPKVYNLGHVAVKNIFNAPVVIQEKVDGSQISFMWKDGELYVRSKSKMQYTPQSNTVDALFAEAIDYLLSIPQETTKLLDGIVFRAEYLKSPKHNVIEYSRIPKNHLVLFDAEKGNQDFVSRQELEHYAEILNIDVIPEFVVIDGGNVNLEFIRGFLNRESFLGGSKVEGIVIKNYHLFGPDGKVLMAKLVSERFKERHKVEWKKDDPIETILKALDTEARWRKAIQHLRENGELEFSPRDIGKILHEIKKDTLEEEEEFIKEILWKAFKNEIKKRLGRGFPEWYKEVYLLERQFDLPTSE